MRCRLVFGVLGMVAVSSSVGWAGDGDSAPSDSDLMFEALKQWRGESSSDSAAVDRLLAAAKRESRRREESIRHGATSTYWRDPYADDPEKLIPVRKEDRDLLDNLREGSRARAEMVMAQTEAVAARADAVAAKAEAARAERLAARAEAQAAKRQAAAGQVGCADPSTRTEGRAGRNADSVGSTRSGESAGGQPSASRVHRIHSHRHQSREASVLSPPIARVERDGPSPSRDQPAPAAAEPSNSPPAGWTSADDRGILVVPIEVSISHARKSAQFR